jgi:hypothetical protein
VRSPLNSISLGCTKVMRVIAGLLIGFLAAVIVVVALHSFVHTMADTTERWSHQNPPPPSTPVRRLLVGAAMLAADCVVPLALVLPVALPLVGWRVAVRKRH